MPYWEDTGFGEPQSVLGVAELLRAVAAAFTQRFSDVRVCGEIHSLKTAPSGHIYFDLKDRTQEALLSCALFRGDAQRLTFRPKAGDVVQVQGALNVYAPRGQMNMVVRRMTPAGAGELYARFLALKERLLAEGVFDSAQKRALPAYPRTIGIITSTQAAALRDVLRTIRTAYRGMPCIVYPCGVQGDGAVQEVLSAMQAVQARAEVDVVLLVRGGGSLSDLWTFNSEAIARAIRTLPVPVVTGIGHETDTTIADLAADCRAATPTAAAALVMANWAQAPQRTARLMQRLDRTIAAELAAAANRLQLIDRLQRACEAYLTVRRLRLAAVGDMTAVLERHCQTLAYRVDQAALRLRSAPHEALYRAQGRFERVLMRLGQQCPDRAALGQRVQVLQESLDRAYALGLERRQHRIAALSSGLSQLEMHRVLRRGYAIAYDEQGRVIETVGAVALGQGLGVQLANGVIHGVVKSVEFSEPAADALQTMK